MGKKYLYGAAVQGIQSFIFRTNKLREIVDASAIVERICEDGADGLFAPFEEPAGQSVIRAAGNVKYLFASREACAKAVLEFPKMVMNHAPGISVSQAVVEMESDEDFSAVSNELEQKLRSQRNKPSGNVRQFGLLGMQRVRRTGLPDVVEDTQTGSSKPMKAHSLADKMFGETLSQAKTSNSIEDFVGQNDWIAIIHADGNGLGQVVQAIAGDRRQFAEFSKRLDQATCQAAREAFRQLSGELQVNRKGIIPMRPVVLGGDDLTVICRGDVALPFVKAYLDCFEKETADLLGEILRKNHLFGSTPHLTACAGVAFVKSSYPFHYGYSLAESLCSYAKADAKRSENLTDGLAPSCLMFHKVQDSFMEDYRQIIQRELTPSKARSFCFGPYYLYGKDNRWTIDQLTEKAGTLNGNEEANAVKTQIRRWMSLEHESAGAAEQFLKRSRAMCASKAMRELLDCATTGMQRGETTMFPAYDLLAYHSVVSQITNES